MAESTTSSALVRTWDGPERCPFCGATLADGGPAFMAHVGDSPACEAGFDLWRERVAGDMNGEWGG